jgi:hypothetical protein
VSVEDSTEGGAAFRVVIPAACPETIGWQDHRKTVKYPGGSRSSMTT